MKELSETGQALMDMLIEIDNDQDFVLGVMCNAGNDTAWQKIIDFINYAKSVGDEISTEQLIRISLYLGSQAS